MLIDPKVKKLIIFNHGGGIVEREIKVSLQRGTNEFQIQNIPASFDPNSASVKLNYLNPEQDKDLFNLQQTVVSLPDPETTRQIINREKSAANTIISQSIDFTREIREDINRLCEASKYRTYDDMKGAFDFIINAKKEGEVIVQIQYFITDLRIRWETTLNVNVRDDGNSAELEAYLVVNNQTSFSYENVELGFAIFELPTRQSIGTRAPGSPPMEPTSINQEQLSGLRNEMMSELNRMKKTQRMKNLTL
ncbi:MAG: hypothetical protein EU541_00295 [Promethearchaeota archaeon]|nr:MAG: hypothetical protein EU541_00295 [Candidatus Lokiarchaeota archaeon]